jgi:hypothetical protein
MSPVIEEYGIQGPVNTFELNNQENDIIETTKLIEQQSKE